LRGDYNSNGTVDAADYTTWRNSLGASGPDLAADGNGDDQVDMVDFGVWKAHYGESVHGAAQFWNKVVATVPESSNILLILAAAGLCGCRSQISRGRHPFCRRLYFLRNGLSAKRN
jgi:hypothetical protein